MMKKRNAALIPAVLAICLLFGACQSQEAKSLDEKILALNKKEITLDLAEDLAEIDALEAALSEKERASLKNSEQYQSIKAQYKALEDAAVQELETIIAQLPAPEELRLASQEEIYAASSAFSRATDAVKARVSNASSLETVVAKMKAYRDSCWVACKECGGDGKVTCSKCHGSGSRPAKYTTPNGKTWDVSQDCPKTEKCNACGGRGGEYVEK